MDAYHLDPNDGMARRCGKPDRCGWGTQDDHRPTAAEARELYEMWSVGKLFQATRKKREQMPDRQTAWRKAQRMRQEFFGAVDEDTGKASPPREVWGTVDRRDPTVLWTHELNPVLRLR